MTHIFLKKKTFTSSYLIVYVTGRPDMQLQRVVSWLAQHNFPHGLVSFADGFTTDPLKHKAEFLRWDYFIFMSGNARPTAEVLKIVIRTGSIFFNYCFLRFPTNYAK